MHSTYIKQIEEKGSNFNIKYFIIKEGPKRKGPYREGPNVAGGGPPVNRGSDQDMLFAVWHA